MNNRERVAFHTLGCKVNQEETASLMEMFRKRGFQLVDFKSPADVYIINTCTVTHTADQKSRQMIRRAISRQPDALVAVVGCYSQVSPDDVLAIPGVDLVVGTRGRAKLVDLVEDILEKKRAGEFVKEVNAVDSLESDLEFEQLPLPDNPQRTRAFLKIEDGCDQYCAYCIIPDARGPVRSLSPELVKEQLGELICAGYREVVLTGVHTSAYGKDLPVGINLAALLRDLVKMPGDFRIRLSSVEPVDVSEELLEVMASSPRICRHLHLPLQSGDDEILEMMQRPYTTADYSELFQKAIKMIPDLAVTTDVMVGFPGETDRHFENTYDFIASLPFRDLHVFKYSPRPGTPAAEMSGQVKPRNKDERSRRLRELADTKARAFAEGALGETLDVLVERSYKKRPGYWQGITDNYLRVIFPSQEKELRGELLPVRMIRLAEEDLIEGETSRGDGSCGRS
ncbi:MAG: tRNA (N(6)-L-threonylcarbamoyladenosine(37)-C(2))-methylthiotransferase MtaB [Syntrophaceticus schinkii]|nr:tRNA (N(6)-L-threonylcarbamoyladenosine(37)-C(2))-methylthiotransferase MtaB [Syntrophaceticus schinkii]MDD4674271.1 tRNA (N(6)-L-threonylcarbamoyladenosine(37)-C(2))-methylthiotransferase MtaB [Syntrophaceticus schinkii]